MGGKGEVKFHQKEKEEGILKGWQEQRQGSPIILMDTAKLSPEKAEPFTPTSNSLTPMF